MLNELVINRFTELSDETWNVLLRVILGLVDYTLTVVNDPNIGKYSTKIVRDFFEIWIYSGTMDVEHY